MTPVARARADYALWMAVSAIHRAHDPVPCGLCGAIGLQIDAASIASDMATASAFPPSSWRARQEVVWEQKLDDAIRAQVAWG